MKSFWHFLKLAFDLLLNIIYPPYCSHCGKFGTYLCPECYSYIIFFAHPFKINLTNPHLNTLLVACHYTEPIPSLIKIMKYRQVKDIGKVLGRLIWESTPFLNYLETEKSPGLPPIITAVPLHPHRQSQRGFNQAQIIAQELALCTKQNNQTQLPYTNLLTRTKNTTNQASLKSKQKRLTNLQNTFVPSPHLLQLQKNNKIPSSVLLIDDVTTTGTTLNECAQILKKHGVKKVVGLVITANK